MVTHYRHRLVQQVGLLGLALPFERLLHQLDVVPPAGLDEELLRRGALFREEPHVSSRFSEWHAWWVVGGRSGRDVPRVPLRVPSWPKGWLVDR